MTRRAAPGSPPHRRTPPMRFIQYRSRQPAPRPIEFCVLHYAFNAVEKHYALGTGIGARRSGRIQCITTTGAASTGCAYMTLTAGATAYAGTGADTTTTGGLGGGGAVTVTGATTGATTTVRAGT